MSDDTDLDHYIKEFGARELVHESMPGAGRGIELSDPSGRSVWLLQRQSQVEPLPAPAWRTSRPIVRLDAKWMFSCTAPGEPAAAGGPAGTRQSYRQLAKKAAGAQARRQRPGQGEGTGGRSHIVTSSR
jgi:hypothetical protein